MANYFSFIKFQFLLHCKYIRPHYDRIAAIRRTSTMIDCRISLQCMVAKLMIKNKGQNTIFEIVKIAVYGRKTYDQK